MKKHRLLVIDDDPDVLTSLRLLLKRHFETVATEGNTVNIHHRLSTGTWDLVLLDMNFRKGLNDGNEGLFWLTQILQRQPGLPVVLMTAYGDVELAVEAMKRGAADFVLKPWTNEKLLETLNAALARGKKLQARPVVKAAASAEIIGESAPLLELLETVDKVAATDANTLILGENGTGKDLIAKRLHAQSNRSDRPFIKVDLGALNENLFESELFGHVRGAFTDARADKPGRFEAARGGTLFLDEIGNLSQPLQAKLLSALQNRVITRLGSNKEIEVDVRLVCATNMPLYEMVNNNEFRQDLLYRINTVELTIPPLRERVTDIPVLAQKFIERFAERYMRPARKLASDALKKLESHRWPGNIRELEHAMERAVILCDTESITANDLNLGQKPGGTAQAAFDTLNLMEMERTLIKKAIDDAHGNISHAARQLGITRAALYRRMEKYDL